MILKSENTLFISNKGFEIIVFNIVPKCSRPQTEHITSFGTSEISMVPKYFVMVTIHYDKNHNTTLVNSSAN